MAVDHLEEDFRFATCVQVAAYSPEELCYKPHLSGFNLSQLLDQLDGYEIASCAAGRRVQVLIQAPGGTALCIANHMTLHDTNVELIIHLTTSYDKNLIDRLRAIPQVIEVFHDLTMTAPLVRFYSGCVVLADEEQAWPFNLAEEDPELLLVHDPKRQCDTTMVGHHFMNSDIWVKRRGN